MPNKPGKLFLIPSPIDQNNNQQFLINWQLNKIRHVKHFFVENEKVARSILKHIKLDVPIQQVKLFKNDSSTSIDEIHEIFTSELNGEDIGLLSDSGTPCIADPGAKIVDYAHKNNIDVEPLIGPSSIIMALMSSGFNGQKFRFLGYVPINKEEKRNFFNEIEKKIQLTNETQIFIETPYRNDQLLSDLIETLNDELRICIASNITAKDEQIISMEVARWKHLKRPSLNKKPCIFLVN